MMRAFPSRRGLLALLVLLAPGLAAPARAQEARSRSLEVRGHDDDDEAPGTIRVTSDSPEYCEQLWRQVGEELHEDRDGDKDEDDPLLADGRARRLAVEGWRMCGEGHLRPGILRLRRALLLLRDGSP